MRPTHNDSLPVPDARRSGIALVIVLGFLSVLVLLGVAFAIVMRTERLAARNFADVARSKQVLQAGLARALSDVDVMLRNADVVYPPWDALPSTDSSGVALPDLLSGEAADFVPGDLWAEATLEAANVKLREIVLDPMIGTIGRYGYLVLNCSGLLDANFVGGSNRTYGAHPSEIRLDYQTLLQELTANGPADLPTRRASTWKRFESLPELDTLGHISPAFLDDDPNSFFVYSRSPTGWYDRVAGQSTSVVYVGGASIDTGAVYSAFRSMGVANPSALTDSLIDYIDPDFRPQQVTNFTTEATPLINEVTIEQVLVGGPAGYTNLCRPSVELWYPFVGVTNPNNYILILGIQFAGAQPPEYNPSSPGRPAGQYTVMATNLGSWSSPGFRTITAPQIPLAMGASSNPPTSFAALRATVTAQLKENAVSGYTVDQITQIPIDMAAASSTPGAPAQTFGVAVTDPRLNYLAAQWRPEASSAASAGAATMGALNSPIANPAAGDGNAATNFYVPNRPLRSTGEIGLLLAGPTPWTTIRFLGAGALPVLDRFSAISADVYRGRVNLNTPHRNVLASAFLGAAAEVWPGQPGAPTLSVTQARDLAQEIISFTSSNPYDNVGDLRNDLLALPISPVLTPLQDEGILRNTADLLTTRSQVYTILLAGQYMDRAGTVAVEQRAVVVVWRDAFPNADGYHENFVRFFKWLGD